MTPRVATSALNCLMASGLAVATLGGSCRPKPASSANSWCAGSVPTTPAVVVTVPIIVFVLFFQRRIVSGLTAGAVKG